MNDQDYNCLFLKDWIYKKYADKLQPEDLEKIKESSLNDGEGNHATI